MLLWAFYLMAPATRAQVPNAPKYPVRHFTDENGLPQNSITGMSFDDSGFIWIATQGGLARFDGQYITGYTKEQLGVDSDRFVKLRADVMQGALYAVNEFGQMVLIQRGTAIRETRYHSDQAFDAQTIAPDRMQGIRIDTARGADGYFRYRITDIPAHPGRYFLYADQKVFLFKSGRMTKIIPFPGKPFFKPFNGEPHLRKLTIAQTKGMICMDNFMSISGEPFYHIGSKGIAFLRFSENGVRHLRLSGEITSNPLFPSGKDGLRIVTNRMSGQAFAILGAYVYQITFQDNILKTKLLVDDFDIEENLVSRLLFNEANHALFLGSFSQGLLKMRTQSFRVLMTSQMKNFHNVYYAHLPYSDSSAIIPDGVVIGASQPGQPVVAGFAKAPPTVRMSMAKDHAGKFWIVKESTLYRLTTDGVTEECRWTLPSPPSRVYQASGHDIWIGTKSGQVFRLAAAAGVLDKPQLVTHISGECTYLYQDQPGRMWIGTSNGLFLYRHADRKLYPVNGLKKMNIRSVYASAASQLWITTYGDGIFLLMNNRMIPIPLDANGYLRHAHCILEDAGNHFWIPTNKGLFRVAREDLLANAAGRLQKAFYVYYNKEDGFQTNEFNGGCQPCGIKLHDGHYSFPSMSGLVQFRPDNVPMPDLSAPILMEHLTADEHSLPPTDTVRLAYDFSHLTLLLKSPFSGLWDNLQMRFSVEKKSSGSARWSDVGTDGKVDIYGLSPGTYHLKAVKTTGFGGRQMEKMLVIIVAKPWFLRWWSVSGALLSALLVLWIFTKWRIRGLTRQNELLGKKVEERTLHLTQALESLKASDEALHTQLEIQMRIIGVINHDLHSPLRYLSTQVPRFLERVIPCIPDSGTANLGTAISKSTLKVYQLADDLLGFVKATYDKQGRISYEDVELKSILDQKAMFFAELAEENATTLVIDCEPGLTVKTNRIMAEILMHNILDNALKHTYSQSVTVTAEQSAQGQAIVRIADTGYGMREDIVGWLNSQKQTSVDVELRKEVPVPDHLGLGLIIVKEIAMLLDIRLDIHSGETGTQVNMLF